MPGWEQEEGLTGQPELPLRKGPANKRLMQVQALGRVNVPSWRMPTAVLEESWATKSKQMPVRKYGTSACLSGTRYCASCHPRPLSIWLLPLPVAWHWLLWDMGSRKDFPVSLWVVTPSEVSRQKDAHQGLLDKPSVLRLGMKAKCLLRGRPAVEAGGKQ